MAPIRRREFGRLADLPMQGSQYTVEACIMLDPRERQNARLRCTYVAAHRGTESFATERRTGRAHLIADVVLVRRRYGEEVTPNPRVSAVPIAAP